ncbi:MAG: hypothetical protein ACR2KE_00010 [Candidatus Nanopelagicales bacterium]
MSVTEQLLSTATQVEGVRGGLDRLREVLEQTDSVLGVADQALGKADEVLSQAAEVMEESKRWAPRVAIVLGVVAVAAIGTVIVLRMRTRDDD